MTRLAHLNQQCAATAQEMPAVVRGVRLKRKQCSWRCWDMVQPALGMKLCSVQTLICRGCLEQSTVSSFLLAMLTLSFAHASCICALLSTYRGHENASWIPPLMSLDLVGGSIRSRPSSTTMARPFTLAKAEPSFATSRLFHKMHGTAFRRRSSGEHRMDMERTANLASEPRRSSGGMGVLMCLYAF